MLDGDARDRLSGHRRIGVDQRGHPETTGGEPAVVGQGGAEVTDTDDDNRPVLGQAEFTGDLVDEILHVVADTARSVGAQVREVLAQLGGVDPRRRGQFLGGDRGYRALRQCGQGSEVQRKPGDGGLGNPSATGRRSVCSASCHGAPAGRAGLQAVIRPQTAPSTAGYVFVNACTKMVSDLPGQRDRGHARRSGALLDPSWGQNRHTPRESRPRDQTAVDPKGRSVRRCTTRSVPCGDGPRPPARRCAACRRRGRRGSAPSTGRTAPCPR